MPSVNTCARKGRLSLGPWSGSGRSSWPSCCPRSPVAGRRGEGPSEHTGPHKELAFLLTKVTYTLRKFPPTKDKISINTKWIPYSFAHTVHSASSFCPSGIPCFTLCLWLTRPSHSPSLPSAASILLAGLQGSRWPEFVCARQAAAPLLPYNLCPSFVTKLHQQGQEKTQSSRLRAQFCLGPELLRCPGEVLS